MQILKPLNGGMIENYTDGGTEREFPPYDFQIISNAILCKMTLRIRFYTYFWPSDKIDRIMANSVNFIWQSKVRLKLDSTDHFT